MTDRRPILSRFFLVDDVILDWESITQGGGTDER